MGGRGSGGSRSGGSGSGNYQELLSNKTINKFLSNNVGGFVGDIQDKLKTMSDFQLEQHYLATRSNLRKAKSKYERERTKLQEIRKQFNETKEGSKEYYDKMKKMDEQIKTVQNARGWLEIRERTHFIVINERSNVRGK